MKNIQHFVMKYFVHFFEKASFHWIFHSKNTRYFSIILTYFQLLV